MENPTLNYTASKIALAERRHGENFFSALETLAKKPSMSGLLFLFNAGGGTDEDFDKLFKEGADKVMVAIMEGLSAGGFLGEEIVEEAKGLLEKASKSPVASQTSGETTKK